MAAVLLAGALVLSAAQPADYVSKEGYGLGSVKGKQRYLHGLSDALRDCSGNEHCRGVSYHGVPDTATSDMYVYFVGSSDKLIPREGWTTHVLSAHEEAMCPDVAKNAQQASQQQQQQASAAAATEAVAGSTEDQAPGSKGAEESGAGAEGEGDEDVEEEEADEEEEEDDEPIPSVQSEALFQEGQLALYALGDDGLRNVTHAVECFNRSASEGHAGAQFMLGFMYTLGLGVPPSEMLAVLYYTFGALGGNAEAALALSYRYTYGYGVPRSCTEARKHYHTVSDRVAKHYRKQAVAPAVTKIRLSDPTALRTKQKEEDLLQYYQYNADRGDASSQMVLGYAFMWGIRGVEQDAAQARKYFEMAAEKDDPSAYGALGNIYAQGINSPTNPIDRNYTKALEYFAKGVELKHPVAYNGMGYLAMRGGGTRRNYTKAVGHFLKAAKLDNPEAQYNLGVLYQEGKGVEKDSTRALSYLGKAAGKGQVLAHWQLGINPTKSCDRAVQHLKTVSEQGVWSKRISDAHKDYLDGDYSSALLKYLIASEYGQEIAHSNAAYMLDNGLGLEELEFSPNPAYHASDLSDNTTEASDFMRYSLALKYYKKATEQGSIEAPVKVGDYHYYGQGTDLNVHKALSSYKLAVRRGSHQAMFNLGYMHERGISISQNFELAKRYYDQAFQSNEHAYWPITLALLKLQFRWWLSEWMEGTETATPRPASKATTKTTHLSEFKLWGHHVEDVVLASLLGMLFLTLFIRHTARQVQVVPPAPAPDAAPAPAAAQGAPDATPADPPAGPAAPAEAGAEGAAQDGAAIQPDAAAGDARAPQS